MKDILEEITRLRLARHWSEYELALHSGLSQSTISTWYRKGQVPTIKSLEKICAGLGITLAQFFAEDNEPLPPYFTAAGAVEPLVCFNERTASALFRSV